MSRAVPINMKPVVLGLVAAGGLVLSVACGGSAFDSENDGGDGAAGSGTDGGIATGGSSATGGTGGIGTGGTSGSGGTAGTGATAGSAGGGGTDVCPDLAPNPGDGCTEGSYCSYPAGCCSDSFACVRGKWVYEGCGGPAVEPICPPELPNDGELCDPCFVPPSCSYVDCESSSTFVASCDDTERWSIVSEPGASCGPQCELGSAFAEQFDKSCADDADCALETIADDCCGTNLLVGVSREAAGELRDRWNVCEPSLVICRCAPSLPRGEDGIEVQDPAEIRVSCEPDGQCRTRAVASSGP